MEEWRDIPGCEGRYQVSNLGNVKSLQRKVNIGKNIRTIKESSVRQIIDKDGYFRVALSTKHKSKLIGVHRLVLIAFVPNIENLPCVNHIDENKQNNKLENLEWVTWQQNVLHGTSIQRRLLKQYKPVSQYTKNNEFINSFKSLKEASEKTGVIISDISSCCHGRLPHAGQFIWRFNNE